MCETLVALPWLPYIYMPCLIHSFDLPAVHVKHIVLYVFGVVGVFVTHGLYPHLELFIVEPLTRTQHLIGLHLEIVLAAHVEEVEEQVVLACLDHIVEIDEFLAFKPAELVRIIELIHRLQVIGDGVV